MDETGEQHEDTHHITNLDVPVHTTDNDNVSFGKVRNSETVVEVSRTWNRIVGKKN